MERCQIPASGYEGDSGAVSTGLSSVKEWTAKIHTRARFAACCPRPFGDCLLRAPSAPKDAHCGRSQQRDNATLPVFPSQATVQPVSAWHRLGPVLMHNFFFMTSGKELPHPGPQKEAKRSLAGPWNIPVLSLPSSLTA